LSPSGPRRRRCRRPVPNSLFLTPEPLPTTIYPAPFRTRPRRTLSPRIPCPLSAHESRHIHK
jgi:hypothetical protein